MTVDLLLLSSSALHGYRPFEFALDALRDLFGSARTVHFVPYARADHDGYTAGAGERLAPLGVSVVGVHAGGDPLVAVEGAEVLSVGGGNSFRLLDALQRHALPEPIRRRVRAGELRSPTRTCAPAAGSPGPVAWQALFQSAVGNLTHP